MITPYDFTGILIDQLLGAFPITRKQRLLEEGLSQEAERRSRALIHAQTIVNTSLNQIESI
jgi:hypothetical protein